MSKLTTLPNILTFTRIALIPVFVITFYLPFHWARNLAVLIFAFASFTDWLDGFLARKLKQSSSFGAFLDPVADKLLISSTLLLLVGARNIDFITLPALIIVGREIVISALREWMAEMGSRVSVAVSYIGKIKTTVQMFALLILIAYDPGHTDLRNLGIFFLYIAAMLTIWSMIIYLNAAWPEFMKKDTKTVDTP
ncbi:MAG: CDP-diacylglycerol--glycerol-3-phosphate 3-phosphatidyltransferase [Legionellaceae bacterium]|nr:CDP-diacylglycerol--glycerol-3-phosphate 3-phosphatidyltransferase [Legionellaceae bacterium]